MTNVYLMDFIANWIQKNLLKSLFNSSFVDWKRKKKKIWETWTDHELDYKTHEKCDYGLRERILKL